jgi:hypothetical protein
VAEQTYEQAQKSKIEQNWDGANQQMVGKKGKAQNK